jgi:hypothetical protein
VHSPCDHCPAADDNDNEPCASCEFFVLRGANTALRRWRATACAWIRYAMLRVDHNAREDGQRLLDKAERSQDSE